MIATAGMRNRVDDVFAAEEAAYRVAPAPALSSTMNMVLGIAAVGVVLLATGAVEAL